MTTGRKHSWKGRIVRLAMLAALMLPVHGIAAIDLAVVNVKKQAIVDNDQILFGNLADITGM